MSGIQLSLQVCEDDDLSADSMLRLNAGYKKYWVFSLVPSLSTTGVGGGGGGGGGGGDWAIKSVCVCVEVG